MCLLLTMVVVHHSHGCSAPKPWLLRTITVVLGVWRTFIHTAFCKWCSSVLADSALSQFAIGSRLTETCVRCIAQHLLILVQHPLFNQLVKESAESVRNREDVDSVPIIDDIRYHVTLLHGDGELSGQLHDYTPLTAQSSMLTPHCSELPTHTSLLRAHC